MSIKVAVQSSETDGYKIVTETVDINKNTLRDIQSSQELMSIGQNRARWLRFRRSSRGEHEYVVRRRLKKADKGQVLERQVDTDKREIVDMARVVAAAGGDPQRFLSLLRQDSESFGVEPDEVYEDEIRPDKKWAYDYTLEEVEQLRKLCRMAHEYGREHREDLCFDDAGTAITRLEELAEFFQRAADIEIAPVLQQG